MAFQEWGDGDPVIALHPLALALTAFAGVARLLAQRGFRTIAVDLMVRRTPGPDGKRSHPHGWPSLMDLAAGLEPRPLLLGMSMGGRVALQVAFVAPDYSARRGAGGALPALAQQPLAPLARAVHEPERRRA